MPRGAINHLLYAMVTRELMVGASCAALAQETGLHVATVRLLIKTMRAQEVVRILRWDLDTRGNANVRVYRLKLSPLEKDAPRPLSDATLARYRRKRRAEERQRAA